MNSLNRAEFPYIGWIPTVNGRLSFRHVGESLHPTEAIYANVVTDDARFILAYQRRPLSDALFPDIFDFFWQRSGDFWFVLNIQPVSGPRIAEQINGTISIFKSKDDWRDKGEPSIWRAVKNINDLRFSLDPQRSQRIAGELLSATATTDNSADIQLRFVLNREGEAHFTKPIFHDEDLRYASDDFAQKYGHDIEKLVADQAYFFLRDICHTHQHHEPDSDTILILQDWDQLDLEWRRNIVYSLYYAIIRTKRHRETWAPYQALGIEAYCMSFKTICGRKFGGTFEEKFNDDALNRSLEARADEATSRTNYHASVMAKRFAHATNFRTFALAGAAIIIALISILVQPRIIKEDREAFPILFMFSDIAAQHFVSILGACLIGIVFSWIITSDKRYRWTLSFGFGRDLLELSNAFRGWAIFILIASGLGLAALSVYLFYPAILSILDAIMAFKKLL